MRPLAETFQLTSEWFAGESNTKKKCTYISYPNPSYPHILPCAKLQNLFFSFPHLSPVARVWPGKGTLEKKNAKQPKASSSTRRPPGVSTSARKTNVPHPVREPNLIGPSPRTTGGGRVAFNVVKASLFFQSFCHVLSVLSSHGAFGNGKA